MERSAKAFDDVEYGSSYPSETFIDMLCKLGEIDIHAFRCIDYAFANTTDANALSIELRNYQPYTSYREIADHISFLSGSRSKDAIPSDFNSSAIMRTEFGGDAVNFVFGACDRFLDGYRAQHGFFHPDRAQTIPQPDEIDTVIDVLSEYVDLLKKELLLEYLIALPIKLDHTCASNVLS